MPKINLTLEGPPIVLDALNRALEESLTVLIRPETIFPGYELSLVESSIDNGPE